MPALTVSDPLHIQVHDAASAARWYSEKMGFRPIPAAADDEPGSIVMKLSEQDQPLILTPGVDTDSDSAPIIFAADVRQAREALSARGVQVGPLSTDRQGMPYFELRDLEGNLIELSQER